MFSAACKILVLAKFWCLQIVLYKGLIYFLVVCFMGYLNFLTDILKMILAVTLVGTS